MSAYGLRALVMVIGLLTALGLADTAGAQKIELKEGQQLEGQIVQRDGDDVVLQVPSASIDVRLKSGASLPVSGMQAQGDQTYLRLPRSLIKLADGKPLPPPVMAGTPAPDFTAVDLSGAPHSMAKNRGQVTLLQFWATWCPHCRADLSKMKALYAREQPNGLRLLTVGGDQNVTELKTFAAKEQIPYPVIAGAAHPEIAEKYETQGIPAYFLVDAKGVIVKTWSGSLTEGSNTDFDAELTKLLSASTQK
ncbi:MAG: TlpA family protein disulfide reductase [Candidatus Omnitrophica bacterium]|nr:TlpA family protein disulfide reductase [Candidatus Omnitrophota bacterium]